MKELKSSLDTIRRTASEIITGIEGQLRELQRDGDKLIPIDYDGLMEKARMSPVLSGWPS